MHPERTVHPRSGTQYNQTRMALCATLSGIVWCGNKFCSYFCFMIRSAIIIWMHVFAFLACLGSRASAFRFANSNVRWAAAPLAGPKGKDGMLQPYTARTSQGDRLPLQTPHSHYHWKGSRMKRRFFEGWYYRLTLPEHQVSFVWMYSVENPSATPGTEGYRLVGAQMLGPDNEYLVQTDDRVQDFWGWRDGLGIGFVFNATEAALASAAASASTNGDIGSSSGSPDSSHSSTTGFGGFGGLVDRDVFGEWSKCGYQATSEFHQGSLVDDGASGGGGDGSSKEGEIACRWEYSTVPLAGWGTNTQNKDHGDSKAGAHGDDGDGGEDDGGDDDDGGQKSTAGWLASFPVFEPHWQVTMAHGSSSGFIEWKGKRFDFQNAPSYAEKNWGGSFPLKWYWVQCNAFQGHSSLSVTAGGGRRQLPFSGGLTEDLGLVGVHFEGVFYEMVPWLGPMAWDVAAWGKWAFTASNGQVECEFEAELLALDSTSASASESSSAPPSTSSPIDGGKVVRAPTAEHGLAPFLRDSMKGTATLSLWKVDPSTGIRLSREQGGCLVDKAKSGALCGVEVGGGPWWEGQGWAGQSRMRQPMKGLVRFPYRARNLLRRVKQKSALLLRLRRPRKNNKNDGPQQ